MKSLLDDIDSLTRGSPTRSRIGSRGEGHRLTEKERELFTIAQKRGFLNVSHVGLRENLINVFTKWCQAKGVAVDIRYKNEKLKN
jgi:hypothetical protein